MKQAERIYKRAKIIGKDIPLKTLNLVPLTLAYPSVEMDFYKYRKEFYFTCVSQINNI